MQTKVTAGKTLKRAGATPLFRLSAAQKVRGVAPARPDQLGAVFCLRAYTDAINPECREETIPIQRKEKITMAILKAPPKQPKTTVVQLRLDDEAKTKLTKYAEFLDCSPSYVVTEAMKLVYGKDKEFQSWFAGQHANNHKTILEGESIQLELK